MFIMDFHVFQSSFFYCCISLNKCFILYDASYVFNNTAFGCVDNLYIFLIFREICAFLHVVFLLNGYRISIGLWIPDSEFIQFHIFSLLFQLVYVMCNFPFVNVFDSKNDIFCSQTYILSTANYRISWGFLFISGESCIREVEICMLESLEVFGIHFTLNFL